MTDEQFTINNTIIIKEKRLTFLKVGDKVKVVSSAGEILGEGIVEREVNSYIVVNGEKYWKRGIDGKHRKRTNYLEFAMNLKDAEEYRVKDKRKNYESSRNSSPIQRGKWR